MRAIFYLTWRKINFVLRSVGLFPNVLALSVDKAGMILYLNYDKFSFFLIIPLNC